MANIWSSVDNRKLGTREIWHRGHLGIADNLAPDNLALRIIWHHGQLGTIQFGTADNLAQ